MAVVEPITERSTFAIELHPAREVVRVRPSGELDLATGPQLRGQVAELIAVGFEDLVIDLRGLTFIDSSGLTLLLALAWKARRNGWKLSLIQGEGQVRRMFALTDTTDQLPFQSADRWTR